MREDGLQIRSSSNMTWDQLTGDTLKHTRITSTSVNMNHSTSRLRITDRKTNTHIVITQMNSEYNCFGKRDNAPQSSFHQITRTSINVKHRTSTRRITSQKRNTHGFTIRISSESNSISKLHGCTPQSSFRPTI